MTVRQPRHVRGFTLGLPRFYMRNGTWHVKWWCPYASVWVPTDMVHKGSQRGRLYQATMEWLAARNARLIANRCRQ